MRRSRATAFATSPAPMPAPDAPASAPTMTAKVLHRVARAKAPQAAQEGATPAPAPAPAPSPRPAPVAPPAAEHPHGVDPAARDARRRLEALFPRVDVDGLAAAPAGAERAASLYLRCNAEMAKLEAEKEVAGNILRGAIAHYRGVEGSTFTATWSERLGEVDWRALCEAHGIDEGTIETYRRAPGRTLRVTGKG